MAEFQAVVMAAGTGSRMFPLTEKIPKALLPVGNLPMVWYPINLLDKAGFEEIIIIVLESAVTQFHQILTSVCNPKLKLNLVPVPDDSDMGTADSLRYIKDKIEKDVILVSCDLITDVALHQLADIHRSHDSTLSAFLAPVPETSADREAANNPKAKKKTDNTDERDFIGIDPRENRLLFFATEADLDEHLVLRKPLLKRYPCISIVKNLMDAHLYIMKKWIVDFLVENKSVSSIKGELIPYLVRKQFQKPKKPRDVALEADISVTEVPEGGETKTDIFNFATEDDITSYTRELSSWSGGMTEGAHDNVIRCHAYVTEGGICLRTNTVPLYMEANKQISRLLPLLTSKEIPLVHPLATIKPKSQVGIDCMVDESVSVGEKVSVKKSIIGKHTTIGEKVKISNSVIMDHVTIKEGCNIQGSIICTNAYIKGNASLKDCQVGNSHTIPEGADLKGEALIAEQMQMDFE